ncbi:MAG: ArsR/SmtB family transcription factor [Chloroflexota bacterium]
MSAASGPATNDLFVALAHPTRRRILRHMLEIDGAISPRELAGDLSLRLSGLSYHVKVLASCGAAELVGTKQLSGSTQHFYRAKVEDEWVRMALDADTEHPDERGP